MIPVSLFINMAIDIERLDIWLQSLKYLRFHHLLNDYAQIGPTWVFSLMVSLISCMWSILYCTLCNVCLLFATGFLWFSCRAGRTRHLFTLGLCGTGTVRTSVWAARRIYRRPVTLFCTAVQSKTLRRYDHPPFSSL